MEEKVIIAVGPVQFDQSLYKYRDTLSLRLRDPFWNNNKQEDAEKSRL